MATTTPPNAPLGRTGHACSQCRDRKQKCGGFTYDLKCRPCTSRKVKCSFEDEANDPRFNPYLRLRTSKSPSSSIEKSNEVANSLKNLPPTLPDATVENEGLPQQMQHLMSRIAELERKIENGTKHFEKALTSPVISIADRTSESSYVQAVIISQPVSQTPLPNLPSPQSLTAKDGPLGALNSLQTEDPFEIDSYDPVARGIVTEGEAHVMFRLYFASCHLNAPFLDLAFDSDLDRVRSGSVILFLSILCIGARFWSASSRQGGQTSTSNGSGPSSWLHPRYSELVQLLDMEVMRVTLRPGSGDLKLETVQALMLCAHWMPFDVCANKRQYRSRFSEAGAWQGLGLAIRCATFLGLQETCHLSFHRPESVSRDDVRRYRTMLYLTESDHYLALSARRPPMLDPRPLHDVLASFLRCNYLQSTDIRLASLFRVAHRAQLIGCRPTTVESVEAFDTDVQIVEKHFISSLGKCQSAMKAYSAGDCSVDGLSQHFPFTSLRWYRLSYACAFLDTVDAPHRAGKVMSWAIEWASQILIHLTRTSDQVVGTPTLQATDQLEPDPSAVSVMSFTIDHYYVVVTYAAFFLVNSWLSGYMNWSLQPVQQPEIQPTGDARTSTLYRLVDLGARTLEAASPPNGHLARRYVMLLRSMLVLIQNGKSQTTSEPTDSLGFPVGATTSNNLEGDFWDMWQQAGLEPIVWPNLLDSWFEVPRTTE